MALLDFLKNKKDAEKSSASAKASADKKNPVKKTEKILAEKKIDSAPKTSAAKNRNTKGFIYEAVKQPHISEKASYLAEKDQYVFQVSANYNKKEVKKAVEGIYGVDVLSVNVINIPAKKRRLGRTEGFKKSYKKAVVRIKEGQKIEIL